MLMYKVKTKNDVFLYRDLAECPILENIIQKPEGCEITELYMDRNGKVCIKRPISIQYMQKVYKSLLEFVHEIPISTLHLLRVWIKYSEKLVEEYTMIDERDVYVIAAKSACMMIRGVFDVSTGIFATYQPILVASHPTVGTMEIKLGGEGGWSSFGILKGKESTFDRLDFNDMCLIDCMPGKTLAERRLLRGINDTVPQWKQRYYSALGVKYELNQKGVSMSTEIEDNQFFVPTELQLGKKNYDLKQLVSFDEDEEEES